MPSRRPVVLLADDDPVGREVVEAMLADDGYELAVARDGGEALAKAKELVPDLILLDVMMPVMNGFQVLRQLRADPVLAEVPVVLVTALHDHNSRVAGIEAGADDFITKPIDRHELRARVRTVTRLDRFRRLQSERAKFEWAVETSDDGFLMLGEQDQVLYANARARLFLDLPAERSAPVEGPFLALCGLHYRCEPEEAWSAWPRPHPEGPAAPRYLVRPESRNVPALWLHVETFPLPSQTEGGWLVRLRDVTDRVHARREVWAFHTAISHKLRTPLAGMIPSLEYLASEAARMTPETVTGLASAAFRGAERLQGEIEDVLEYLEVSRKPWTGQGFDLAELPGIASSVAAAIGIEPPSVSGEEEVRGARVTLSGTAAEIVLDELMENSRKFHPRQSPRVEVLLSRTPDAHASVTLRDDGVSLPPERLARALRPYYQVERDNTGQVAGMGLGLSMVASIVWSVGGACRVRNRTDAPGVVVELLLPLQPPG